jgi:hypothetical protein
MKTTANRRTTLTRDQLDHPERDEALETACARFPDLRAASAARWLVAGERLGTGLLAFAARLARRGARARTRRRAERLEADEIAYGL